MALIWKDVKSGYGTGRKELDLAALEPGDRVALINSRRMGGREVTVYTVDRFTPTRVYLAAGPADRRYEVAYRLADGKRHGEWGWVGDLKDPADRRVVTILQVQRMRAFREEADRVLRQRTEDLAQMDDLLGKLRELEEECRADLARMESSVKEVAADA